MESAGKLALWDYSPPKSVFYVVSVC